MKEVDSEIQLAETGRRFHQYLRYKGLRNNEAAELLGTSPGSIGNVINGKNFSSALLLAVTDAFPGLNLIWLLEGIGKMEQETSQERYKEHIEALANEVERLATLPKPKTDALAKERVEKYASLMEQLIDMQSILNADIAHIQQAYFLAANT